MRLSKETQYALRGLTQLALLPPGAMVGVGSLAASAGLPRSFLAKIFGGLALHGLLRAQRGRSRGFSLARLASEISILEVLEAVEGPTLFQRCVFMSETCSDQHPCQMHGVWSEFRPQLQRRLASLSLRDLAEGRWDGRTDSRAG